MEPKDNAPVAEAVSAPTPEPSVATVAPGSDAGAEGQENKVNAQDEALDAVTLKKELEKARMEANLHKNKVKEYEKAKEEARKAELSEVERLKEELNELHAEKSRREAMEFRDGVISDYLKDNPTALKAAKALIAKNPANLVWGAGEDGGQPTEAEARAQLESQLDALVEVLGVPNTDAGADKSDKTKKAPAPRASNPRSSDGPTRAELIAEARETGDFTKIIGSLPSFRAQHLSVEE